MQIEDCKPGMRVRIVKYPGRKAKNLIGQEGVIVVSPSSSFIYVKLDKRMEHYFGARELEPISED